ncbi:ornithine decarboxylase 1A, chloroplastic-like [Magnolia sinica]|uniref:ornithine decarboxylase 1A, chloroplastic-like n=1 Tax=Magnolia sinica TaxID=86752 RepID=UPI002658909B|nr:ornithine decarboxylase 1A, chloroplastic-like [Magnolia sinica]
MDRQQPLLTFQSLMKIPSLRDTKVREIPSSISHDPLHSTIISIIDEEAPLDPFYIMDLGLVITLYHSWVHHLPSIKPFFPVRCNPDRTLLTTLAALGSGFDCGSQDEISHVISLSVPPDRILFSNPCKAEEHIKHAARVGVNMLVFDSIEELDKVRKCHPHSTLLLQIACDGGTTSQYVVPSKYGALAHEVAPLLRHAQRLRLDVVGISLDSEGSGSQPKAHGHTLEAAYNAIQAFPQVGQSKPRIINVGGGFSSNTGFPKEAIAIRQSLQAKFPELAAMTVIASPGRFLAETASVLVTNLIGKRIRGDLHEYWINDGVYGSMNGVVYHKKGVQAMPFAYVSRRANPTCKGLPTFRSTVFGPTCDALDTVFTDRQLPELCVGDWLLFPNMGAYTHASATNFNGFFAANIRTRYIFTKPSYVNKG